MQCAYYTDFEMYYNYNHYYIKSRFGTLEKYEEENVKNLFKPNGMIQSKEKLVENMKRYSLFQ